MGHSSNKVLIVDDEKMIADTLGRIFADQGVYESRSAYSAEAALEVIEEWQPDLVILDVILPKMHGLELAISLKINHPSCQVLLFSGHYRTESLIDEAENRGHCFPILAKPIHPIEILSAAENLLRVKEDRNSK